MYMILVLRIGTQAVGFAVPVNRRSIVDKPRYVFIFGGG
jgi:hypothetical protein